ncbi:hypothetical protein C7B65_10560 [Phormidesmis priestleyi ULC007]|uniref:Ycf66 family protein n=1 Tax=Phormidesmis priestleyi ULC007 TaxID=1920490 RepID=A0A2T1DGX4_9CYAN|nr:Ycf66 family protein [Phormidesmis priestleyi]PSB19726.1 hypothetical protein C7B65_10560 [Phormidesmis priestleyi ULC007]PZO53610.1 MAG: hypothetical protein DCF14_04265 [Phormidesmis priestleyi]
MLTFILALGVGLGSFALYLAAFFYPELHRKGDLVWSGVGLFYALVLWVCAERITGGVLLGQMASVSLIGWLGWQTLVARSAQTPAEQRSTTGDLSTDLQAGLNRVLSPENTAKVKQQFTNLRDRAQSLINKTPQPQNSAETQTPQVYEPLKPEDFGTPPTTVDATTSSATPAPQVPSSTPVAPQPASSPQQNPLAALTEAAKSVLASFNKPKKNTATYVRKDFRDATPSVQEDADDFEEDDQTATSEAPPQPPVLSDENATSDSTIPSDEIMLEEMEFEAKRAAETAQSEAEGLQPIPPKPPTPDLVEAAIADAEEKHLPADPPETAQSDE